MSKNFIIGIDCGTSSTRAILFDEEGKIYAKGTSEHEILRPRLGWVEQKAEWWWEALKNAICALFDSCAVTQDKIIAMSITHQRITAVPVDDNIEPLRNAILWNDVRCSPQVKSALEKIDAQHIFLRTGYKPGIWTIYKIMWIKDNEPEVYKKIYKVLLVQDYLLYKLTGKLVTTSSSSVMTGCLDLKNKHNWATDIIETFNISSSIWVNEILKSGEKAGVVSKKASKETGLKEGLPIIASSGDQPCGIIGAGVTKPYMASINGGTSCTVEMICENLPLKGNEANYFIEISPMDSYLLENSISSGGSALMNWLRDLLRPQLKNTNEIQWDQFYNLANDAPPGNWGLMFIPYLSGAHAPYWDVSARGVIFGLSLDHNLSHFVRSIIEGLGYEVRRQISLMSKASGNSISEIRMYGGSSKSDLWNQVFADITGVKVCTTETAETTALGAAICASIGVGLFTNIYDAVDHMVRVKNEFYPDRSRQLVYDELFSQIYSKFYDRVHDLIHRSSVIIENLIKG